MANHYETEWQFDPGTTLNLKAGDTYILDTYTPDTWNGTEGNLVTIQSDTPGTQATIDISAIGDIGTPDAPVEYMDFQDIKVVGGTIYANGNTCVGADQNNENIEFVSSSVAILGQSRIQMGMTLAI